jgi:hypothetical protein
MVQLASASGAITVVDRAEPRPWSPGPVLTTLERALDVDDLEWCDAALRRRLRRHRRRVVSSCVRELRAGSRVLMDEWRRQAAARADYSGPDPVMQRLAIEALLVGIEGLATWTITLGLPQPSGGSAIVARMRSLVVPVQPLLASQHV